MDAHYFRTIYDYNYWARDKLLAACAGLSQEEYERPNGFTYGSIRGILIHTLAAEAGYASGWFKEAFNRITDLNTPTLDDLVTRWHEEEKKLRGFLPGLQDGDLTSELVLRREGRPDWRRPLWHDLAQVANHSTQHRSEAAEALTMIGRSPGDLDLGPYLASSSR